MHQLHTNRMTHDFLIVGGGIFGITAAIELAQRNYRVGLLNPATLPHHLAASTDVTKAVRMEYGSDTEYFHMAEISIDRWHDWNERFGETLYHEVGFLMLCRAPIESPQQTFERSSYEQLLAGGYTPERLDAQAISKYFPGINTIEYPEAIFNARAGYAESGRVVEVLTAHARNIGVDIYEGQTAHAFDIQNGRLAAVLTREGHRFPCGHAIVAAGAHTPVLLPELQPYMKSTGHPVFWLQLDEPQHYQPPHLSVFTADISNTGWYGFPWIAKQGIMKVAKHTNGMPIHPDRDDRRVTDAEVKDLRDFLKLTFPKLTTAPLVYTRRCLYTDTLDGHFWIDQHPAIEGLSVSSGGSGHGMKMTPLLGEMTADMAEGKTHRFAQRYRWRHLDQNTIQVEQARYVPGRKI